MVVVNLITRSVLFNSCKPDLLLSCLQNMERTRVEKIQILQERIKRYELKRAKEQTAYHKMSAFQKLLKGRPHDTHLAVEHMVYIKQPLQEIEKLNEQIIHLNELMERIREGYDSLSIRPQFSQELELLYSQGWADYEQS